jgi:hypothetical protein
LAAIASRDFSRSLDATEHGGSRRRDWIVVTAHGMPGGDHAAVMISTVIQH